MAIDKTLLGLLVGAVVFGSLPTPGSPAQSVSSRPPVIDMHVHSTNTTSMQELARMKALNIRYVFVAGLAPDLPEWTATLDARQFLPALVLPCNAGRALFVDRSCWDAKQDFPDPTWLREQIRNGHIRALGELVPEYLGIPPGDVQAINAVVEQTKKSGRGFREALSLWELWERVAEGQVRVSSFSSNRRFEETLIRRDTLSPGPRLECLADLKAQFL